MKVLRLQVIRSLQLVAIRDADHYSPEGEYIRYINRQVPNIPWVNWRQDDCEWYLHQQD